MKKVRYLAEFIVAFIFIKFFQLLPIWLSSNICGFIVKHLMYFVGNFTKDNAKGMRHLSMALPLLSDGEKIKILKSSYENVGRFIAEYVNQHKMNAKWFQKNVEVVNGEYFINQAKNGCFPFTAHFGNWEVMQRFLMLNGADLSVIYNPLQNPYNNKIYLKQREVNQIPKGSNAMKQLIILIKQKKSIGILVDQRDKAGELFKFFNQDAKTSTAIQRLSVKYNHQMLPVKCERSAINKNKFILTAFPTLNTTLQKPEEAIKGLTEQSLKMIEDWIRASPQNWLLWNYARWRIKFN